LAETDALYVSAISAWEVAKLVEKGRLRLPVELHEWFDAALDGSAVGLLGLSPAVATESTTLPGEFHTDPADQIIVATARIHSCSLVTADRKILAYEHVVTIPIGQ
jgi:PIN domain nuclease of toxin-antitoxin system